MKEISSVRRAPARNALLAAGAGTAALGSVAVWVAHRARQAEVAAPPTGKFVTVDGVRIHYLEFGEGPPIVLLHGNMLRAQDFVASGLAPRLATTHRVIVIDRPGYGYSERPAGRRWTAEAQAALLQKMFALVGIERPTLVAHSWATLVALELALCSEIEKLILVSGYYFPTMRADVLLAAPATIPVVGSVLRYTVSPVVARMTLKRTVKAMFAPRPVPVDFLPILDREMLMRPKQLEADAQDAVFMIPGAARLRKHFGDIQAPVVIFAGDQDRVVDPDAHARQLHTEIRGSDLHMLEGVGHMAHYAVPDQIVAAARASARAPL